MKNIFGTDGIRCTIGNEPLTVSSLIHLGNAIAQWATTKYGYTPTILLGHDTRQSCALVKSALQTGLLLHGVTIYDAQVVPTPTVCQILKYNSLFDLGIIISASHNPFQDNGIKIIDKISGKLNIEDELALSQHFFTQSNVAYSYNNLGSVITWPNATQEYYATLQKFLPPDYLQGKKIVLDCAHGATSFMAQQIFEHYGATVIVINNTPDGKNINDHCGALHPQTLQHAVITNHADIGFAFDGDGDRVITVNHLGQVKDGDDMLTLLFEHPSYKQQVGIVGTVMTNQGFAAHMHSKQKQLHRTPVGDKYVGERLEKEQLLLGGEQSGHVILRDYLNTGDGIFTALRLLQAIIHTDNWDMVTFVKFPQILINIPVEIKKDLTTPQLATIIAEHEAQLYGGRLLVRYSGTESVLRVMVEDSDSNNANYIGTSLCKELAKKLSTP